MIVYILDACCGSRMFWEDKKHPNVTYMDCRELSTTLSDGRALNIEPDIVGDFRAMPFESETFHHVVFDPPHLLRAGENSWLAQKYGKLNADVWPQDIKQGYDECMRVLKHGGTLNLKWNEDQIKLSELKKAIGEKPLYGFKRGKTHWLTFVKGV